MFSGVNYPVIFIHESPLSSSIILTNNTVTSSDTQHSLFSILLEHTCALLPLQGTFLTTTNSSGYWVRRRGKKKIKSVFSQNHSWKELLRSSISNTLAMGRVFFLVTNSLLHLPSLLMTRSNMLCSANAIFSIKKGVIFLTPENSVRYHDE